eukprot:4053673-Lingulodinium_polyedra.AAC.1
MGPVLVCSAKSTLQGREGPGAAVVAQYGGDAMQQGEEVPASPEQREEGVGSCRQQPGRTQAGAFSDRQSGPAH